MAKKIENLELVPEGAFGVEFAFGWECGRQKTPGVAIRWRKRPDEPLCGGVLLDADVRRLRDWLTAVIETQDDKRETDNDAR